MSTEIVKMPPTHARLASLALAAALGLSACASSGTRPANPSNDQEALYDYAGSFATEGAVTGAILLGAVGCLAGVLVADSNALAGCAIGGAAGAAGGALLGGGAGYIVGANSDYYANEEARLRGLSEAAEFELLDARRARQGAENAVTGHRERLGQLKARVKSGNASKKALERALEVARYDQDQIGQARDGLEDQISELDSGIWQAQERGVRIPRELVQQRNALVGELKRLNQQYNALTAEIEGAETLV